MHHIKTVLLLVSLLLIALTLTVNNSLQQSTPPYNVSIPAQSNVPLSNRVFRFGYFRVAFTPLNTVGVEVRVQVQGQSTTELVPNSFTNQQLDSRFTSPVNITFKFNPIKNPQYHQFVLFNPTSNVGAKEAALVRVDHVIDREEYGELDSKSNNRYAYMQKGDAEKVMCRASDCIDSRRSLAIEIYPNYLTDSEYSSVTQNTFPITLDVVVSNKNEGYYSNGYLQLSDNTRRTGSRTVVLKSKDDFQKLYFVMESGTESAYIWISCSEKTYYGICSIRYRVMASSESNGGGGDIGGIIGVSIGGAVLVTGAIVTIIVIVCCVKRVKKKRALKKAAATTPNGNTNGGGELEVIVTNGDQITSSHHSNTNLLLAGHEKGRSSNISENTSYTTLNSTVSSTIDTYREPMKTTGDLTMKSLIPMTSSSLMSNASSLKTTSDNGGAANMLNKRYEVIQKIGNGAFGHCYLCNDTKRNQKVAIKCIGTESSEQDKIFSELSKTATIQHERLVQVFELFVSQELSAFCLVMKYYGGVLEKFLKEYNKPLSEKSIVSLMNQLGEGLDYLHSVKMFVHRDLKPKNIFVDVFQPEHDNIQVVIGDLGEAKELFGTDSHSMRGTLAYLAPETLNGEQCGYAVDIFALGVTFYQIVMMDSVDARISTQLLGKNEEEVLEKLRHNMLSSKSVVNEKIVDFIISMLRKDPNNRPTALDLKKFSV